MKATVTNKNKDYFYILEDIVNVLYIEKEIEITYKKDNEVCTARYNTKDVMISIF